MKNPPFTLNDFFDNIYCINLQRRVDRWDSVKEKFEKFNIKVEKFFAIDGNSLSNDLIEKYKNINKHEIGCMLSHYEIIKDAKNKNYKNILIFEDDIIFAKNFNELFSNQVKKIKDWKILYLGASQCKWENIEFNDGFYYSKTSLGTFAIAFDNSVYDDILNTYNIVAPIDAKIISLQNKYYKKCYTFYPNLVIANVSNSDIRGNRDNQIYAQMMRWDLSFYDIIQKKPTKDKINILLLPDSPNWAFDNIASAIIKYNPYPDKISYEKFFIKDRPKIKFNDYDYIYIMFEGERTIYSDSGKTIRGCYSAFWLENPLCTPEKIGERFSECRAAIFVNEILEEIISPFCKEIPYTVIPDSSDEEIFYPIPGKKLKEFTAIFVGNPNRPIKNFKSIEYICEQSGVNLVVLKDIPYKELVNEYAKADICINYSISEGGPQTFIEAALCEIPMLIKSDNALAQKIPCFKEMTKKSMIEKLIFLKNNRDLCEKVGKEAREIALKEYTYKKAAKKFADFFLNLKNEK